MHHRGVDESGEEAGGSSWFPFGTAGVEIDALEAVGHIEGE